jgi:hypothetical protein
METFERKTTTYKKLTEVCFNRGFQFTSLKIATPSQLVTEAEYLWTKDRYKHLSMPKIGKSCKTLLLLKASNPILVLGNN